MTSDTDGPGLMRFDAIGWMDWTGPRCYGLIILPPSLDGMAVAMAMRDRPSRCGYIIVLTSADLG